MFNVQLGAEQSSGGLGVSLPAMVSVVSTVCHFRLFAMKSRSVDPGGCGGPDPPENI